MKSLHLIFGATACAASGANYSFKGTASKNPLEYTSGETMAFTVTLVDKAEKMV